MALRTTILSNVLAHNALITDYDFWRAERRIEDELFVCLRWGKPVPIELIYARRIVASARAKRNGRRK
ncbi:MAG: hypothetical protein JJ913_19060 [Rhizobiaceae bacterium]|nr:hypothetical protein [Rhizobiaceae bacterium]